MAAVTVLRLECRIGERTPIVHLGCVRGLANLLLLFGERWLWRRLKTTGATQKRGAEGLTVNLSGRPQCLL